MVFASATVGAHLYIDGQLVDQVSEFKYLGITLDPVASFRGMG